MPVNYKKPILNLIVAIMLILLLFYSPVYFIGGVFVITVLAIVSKSINLTAWLITISLFLAILVLLLLPHAP
ncbi:hypothetical protein RRU94_02535 [Domibacillus sp. DTU_2020_1001157_1_SI_ALB_TIR_016]|uniref:hypothetical protein n=1 Tax=Domibacillus sp. DTU_2020_1001157_1_SI_ALB_TIR_016 TaxID=3077789 RepID=UPI0028F00303|nr:hypothetical protein [Domibacillus sp. DTU_2020_1001157_1_SI_ALB_TIR_016]WNS78842.1 hypothetical protein RRU94_02535 [Domibacillus sp. DTU_2020_1001157_1_SI_ALB_TIR_016]